MTDQAKRGRPFRDGGTAADKRPRVTVRLTKREHDRLTALAAAKGLKPVEWIRLAINSAPAPVSEKVRKRRGELRKRIRRSR